VPWYAVPLAALLTAVALLGTLIALRLGVYAIIAQTSLQPSQYVG
jgi:hypothetical protein